MAHASQMRWSMNQAVGCEAPGSRCCFIEETDFGLVRQRQMPVAHFRSGILEDSMVVPSCPDAEVSPAIRAQWGIFLWPALRVRSEPHFGQWRPSGQTTDSIHSVATLSLWNMSIV